MSEPWMYRWDAITYGEAMDSCLKMAHEYPIRTSLDFDFVDECIVQIVKTLDLCLHGDGFLFGLIHLGLLRQKLARLEHEYLESIGSKTYQEAHN